MSNDNRRECPDNCPGCNASGTVGECSPDNRREGYAAAITAARTRIGFDAYSTELADAAMAVADAEIQGAIDVMRLKVDSARDENARLRAEQKTADEYAAKMRDEIDRWRVENARLRAELERKTSAYDELADTATRSNARLRAERDDYRQRFEAQMTAGAELVDENKSLRTELSESQTKFRAAAIQVERARRQYVEAVATIDRVRSVLCAADLSDRETGFYMDTRAALEGEQ